MKHTYVPQVKERYCSSITDADLHPEHPSTRHNMAIVIKHFDRHGKPANTMPLWTLHAVSEL
jgi:hypothetical protein